MPSHHNGVPVSARTYAELFAGSVMLAHDIEEEYIVQFTGDAFANRALNTDYESTVMRLLSIADIDHIVCEATNDNFLHLAKTLRPPRVRLLCRGDTLPRRLFWSDRYRLARMAEYRPGVTICTSSQTLRESAQRAGLPVEDPVSAYLKN